MTSVTMEDVAKRAGVSSTTVSHVVNDTRAVNPETRQRVLDAIDAIGYVPNRLARSLVRASTQLLGLAMSVMTNHYFADLAHVIETRASEAGYVLVLADTHEKTDYEQRVIDALHAQRVDGLFIAPTASSGPALDRLHKLRIPTVLVDRMGDVRFDAVGSEGAEAMRELTQHLIVEGHTSVGFVAGLMGLSTTDDRLKGYRLAMIEADLDPDNLIEYGSSSVDEGSAAVHRLLDCQQPPTALVVANNAMAIGAMLAIRDREMEVPRDIALVAFDDFEWANAFSPRLTTIAQDTQTIGETAVRMLLERIAQPNLPVRQELVPASIVHRDSCGCGRF